MSHRGFFFCALLVSLAMSAFAQSAPAPAPATPEEIMDAIHALMMEPETRDGGDFFLKQILELRDRLGECGPEAAPVIKARFESEPDARTREMFLHALGKIPGEEVDRFLLRLFCFDQTEGQVAEAQLAWRMEHLGPLTFRVPEDQMEAMLAMVRDRPVIGVGRPIGILARCHRNALKPIFSVVLARFAREVKTPGDPSFSMSYLSPHAYVMSKFLRLLMLMPEGVVPLLREARAAAEREDDQELAKWLIMALGYCGDGSAGDALREIVLHEPDRYVRCLAIRPYGRVAGVKAVPVLRPLLEDTTETEYHTDFPPARLIIRGAARAALMEILREAYGDVDISYENFEAFLDAVERGETPPK